MVAFFPRALSREQQIHYFYCLRVIDAEGANVGVMSNSDAQKAAQAAGLDLIEISPTAKPPIAKIMEYGKYLYEQKKKQKEKEEVLVLTVVVVTAVQEEAMVVVTTVVDTTEVEITVVETEVVTNHSFSKLYNPME